MSSNSEVQIGGGSIISKSINKLPDVILLQILRYLPVIDRCQAWRVCKNWKRILCDYSLWRHVDLQDNPTELKSILKIVKICQPCLLTLKIKGYANADDPNRMRPSLSDPMLRELTARCPNLRQLHLLDCIASNISFDSLPPSITCLELVNTMWQPRWMRFKQKHLPNLQHLTLDHTVWINQFEMRDVVVWKNLKHLSLVGCYRVGTAGVKTIADHLSELEFLNLSSTDIEDLAVNHIAQQLKKLKELYLASCTFVSDEAVVSIAVGLPELTILNISYCDLVTMKGLESLFASNLSVLIVQRMTSLSEEEKQTLKRGFPEHFILIA